MPESPDAMRLRDEYAERTRRFKATDKYSLFNLTHLFIIQQRQRCLLKFLRDNGFYPLMGKRILEVGSGSGDVLQELLRFGASTSNLHGVELLFDHVQISHQSLNSLLLICGDGQYLPYTAHSFDLTLQFTVFSSVLDAIVKANLASEMLRVTKPSGLILWYDFWFNPSNPKTKGIRPQEIRRLFPNCEFNFRKITLAPPIVRLLVPISWLLCAFLEKLILFNTHYLVAIRPNN